jgi:hypothetical protein
MLERKKDYIHPALRADETTMLSKPQKCHFDNQTETEGECTTDKHAGSGVRPNNPMKRPHERGATARAIGIFPDQYICMVKEVAHTTPF